MRLTRAGFMPDAYYTNEASPRGLFGKLFGDKGYISKELFQRLYLRGLRLITRINADGQTAVAEAGHC